MLICSVDYSLEINNFELRKISKKEKKYLVTCSLFNPFICGVLSDQVSSGFSKYSISESQVFISLNYTKIQLIKKLIQKKSSLPVSAFNECLSQ